MKDKGRTQGTFKVYLRWPLFLSILMVILTAVVETVSIRAGIIVSVFTIVYVGTALWLYFSRRRGILAGLIVFSSAYDQSRQNLVEEILMPYAVADGSGHLLWTNQEFTAILAEGEISYRNITAMLPDITKEMLAASSELISVHSFLGGREFRIDLKQIMVDRLEAAVADDRLEGWGSFVTAIYLVDETQTLLYMQQTNDQELVTGLIYLDNYDETLESVEEIRRSLLTALIGRKISKYISDMNGIVKKLEKDRYFFIIKQQYMAKIQERRFSILEDMKTANIDNDMAMTLNIGIGMNGGSYSQNYDYARTSADMALGQGGDRAIVEDSDKIQYYSSKAQQMEKTTRVKARVKTHALRELIENRGRLSVMGHRLANVDSFGVTVGIYRIVVSMNKKANIVVNEVTSSVHPMVNWFIGNAEYLGDMFLTGPRIPEMADQGTILVIVSINRPSITDKPVLLRGTRTVVVLDHHRTSSKIIDNAVLSYVEPYASSICEMMAEVLQYITDGVKAKPAEADAIHAGIVVDTQNLTNQTGVRTFEAAAFLRRSGTDITRVRKLFRENMRDYQAEAGAVHEAEVYMDAFAIGECSTDGLDSPTIIGAQTANELLEVRDIKASVTLTDYNDTIYFGAHSIDEINMQVMMEKLGGGGRRTMTDAQMEGVSVEDAKIRLKEVIRQMLEEDEVSWE